MKFFPQGGRGGKCQTIVLYFFLTGGMRESGIFIPYSFFHYKNFIF